MIFCLIGSDEEFKYFMANFVTLITYATLCYHSRVFIVFHNNKDSANVCRHQLICIDIFQTKRVFIVFHNNKDSANVCRHQLICIDIFQTKIFLLILFSNACVRNGTLKFKKLKRQKNSEHTPAAGQ
jgi:hypothetical protein